MSTIYMEWQEARERRNKAIGKLATAAINTSGETLNRVIRSVETQAREAGFEIDTWVCQDAVKARVTIGRCRNCESAYWFPKREGRLADKACPECGHCLNQTSLALRRGFDRLP